MKWLISLETDNDPITVCRLMNIFRRKGMKISTLTLAAQPAGFSLMLLVEAPEADAEHIFNFLRTTAGVHHVDSYRHEPSADASYLFLDGAEDSSSVARILETLPGAKLLFAGHGKFLLEVPAAAGKARSNFAQAGFLPFARVRTTREAPQAVPAAC
jgi:acetolactate synthase regulatory subunit